jgi:hypothetical protein
METFSVSNRLVIVHGTLDLIESIDTVRASVAARNTHVHTTLLEAIKAGHKLAFKEKGMIIDIIEYCFIEM